MPKKSRNIKRLERMSRFTRIGLRFGAMMPLAKGRGIA